MNEIPTETIHLPLPSGGHLYGLVNPAREPGDFAVCFIHGLGSVCNGEKSQALQVACQRRGWTFAAFDFRGHGQSSGTMNDLRCDGLLQDLEIVREFLLQRGIARVFPVGSSMGGWAASWFALRNRASVPACALLAPAFHFPLGLWNRLTDFERERWQRSGRLHLKNQWLDLELAYELIAEGKKFPLEQLLSGWQTPALIFHGMKDDLIPTGRIIDSVEKISFPHVELRLFKSGDHRLSAFKEEIAEEICRFFTRWL